MQLHRRLLGLVFPAYIGCPRKKSPLKSNSVKEASLTSSFAPFGRSGRVTRADSCYCCCCSPTDAQGDSRSWILKETFFWDTLYISNYFRNRACPLKLLLPIGYGKKWFKQARQNRKLWKMYFFVTPHNFANGSHSDSGDQNTVKTDLQSIFAERHLVPYA